MCLMIELSENGIPLIKRTCLILLETFVKQEMFVKQQTSQMSILDDGRPNDQLRWKITSVTDSHL